MTWWPGARARLFCHSSQMDSIIQWNCPGLKINFREITILVQANSSLSSVQLKNVTNQLNTPLIIMGDITPYRISKQQRQKTWSLSLFSDGTDTYLHPGNGSYLAIDIYDTDSSLLLDFAWNINTFYWNNSKLRNILLCILFKTERKVTYLIKNEHNTFVYYLQEFRPQYHISDRGQHFQ